MSDRLRLALGLLAFAVFAYLAASALRRTVKRLSQIDLLKAAVATLVLCMVAQTVYLIVTGR